MTEENILISLDSLLVNDNMGSFENMSKLAEVLFENNNSLEAIINNPVLLYNFDFLIEQYFNYDLKTDENGVRKELFKINMEEINSILDDTSFNDDVLQHFRDYYISIGKDPNDVKLIDSISDKINSQYMNTSRLYKMKKGTSLGFEYIFNLLNSTGMNGLFEGSTIEVSELDEPFKYVIKTQVNREIIKDTLLKIAHPCGFQYEFLSYLYSDIEDFYSYIYQTFYDYIALHRVDSSIIFELKRESQYSNNLISTYGDGLKDFKIIDNLNSESTVYVYFNNNLFYKELDTRYIDVFYHIGRNEEHVVNDDDPSEIKNYFPNDTKLKILIKTIELVRPEIGDLYFEEDTDPDGVGDGKFLTNFKLKNAKTLYLVNRDTFKIKYQIQGDKSEDIWYFQDIPLGNPNVSQDDNKVYEDIPFTRLNVLENESYDGIYLNTLDNSNYYEISRSENTQIDILKDEIEVDEQYSIGSHILKYSSTTCEDVDKNEINCRPIKLGMTYADGNKMKIGDFCFKVGQNLVEEIYEQPSDYYWTPEFGSFSYVSADSIFTFDVFDADGNKIDDDNRSAAEE